MLKLQVPSSKSVSHRMLMGAALANGKSIVHNALISQDIQCTMEVLSLAGASFTPYNDSKQNGQSFQINGINTAKHDALTPISCYMHESGTSARLLTAILSTCPGLFRIHGAQRLHQRPMLPLTKALQELDVTIEFQEKKGHMPFILLGQNQTMPDLKDNEQLYSRIANIDKKISIDCDASSQYLSGLLMAAPRMPYGLCIHLQGEKIISWPYVGLTLQCLENFAIPFQVEIFHEDSWQSVNWKEIKQVEPNSIRFCIPQAAYQAGEYSVEGDWSSSSYLIAAATLGSRSINIQGLNPNSLQGDREILNILRNMGGSFTWEGGLCVAPAKLYGIKVDMGKCPDLVPTVALMAAFAEGTTTIYNCAHLRLKESDRIVAPATELRKVGVEIEELNDGLRIKGLGKPPVFDDNTIFSTHNDHRIAMSLALLGLHGQKPQMDDITVVQKSFPNFWEIWEQIHA